jgi:hypothetical protein
MTRQEAPREGQNLAYFVRTKNAEQLVRFNSEFKPLFGSDMLKYDSEGELYFLSFHSLPKERTTPDQFIQISRDNPRADIFSNESRVQIFREARVNHVSGGLESGIRAMDHILESETNREAPQIKEMGARAHALFDLFVNDYSTITEDQLKEAEDRTYVLLALVHLHPERIIDEEKNKLHNGSSKGI